MSQNLNEMAKAARERIIARLPDNKKIILILNNIVEKCEQARVAKLPTRVVVAQLTNNGITDTESVLREFGLDPNNDNVMISSLKNKLEPYKRLYSHILRTININKDDVDKNYLDKIYNYIKDMENGEPAQEAYRNNDIASVIQWIRDDEAEAKDRFGNEFRAVMNRLNRWINPPQQNSPEDLLLRFNDFIRESRKEENRNKPMDDDLKYRLALLIQQPNAAALCHDTETRPVSQQIKSQVERFFPDRIIPSVAACKMFLGEDVSEEELTPIERVQYRIDQLDTSTPINAKIKELTAEAFSRCKQNRTTIDEDKITIEAIGKVSKPIVKAIYKHAKTTLNREYHVGREFPFMQESLQAFYDEYKMLFKLGFVESVLTELFNKIASYIHDVKEEEIRNGIRDIDEVEDDLAEALKIVRQHGYIV